MPRHLRTILGLLLLAAATPIWAQTSKAVDDCIVAGRCEAALREETDQMISRHRQTVAGGQALPCALYRCPDARAVDWASVLAELEAEYRFVLKYEQDNKATLLPEDHTRIRNGLGLMMNEMTRVRQEMDRIRSGAQAARQNGGAAAPEGAAGPKTLNPLPSLGDISHYGINNPHFGDLKPSAIQQQYLGTDVAPGKQAERSSPGGRPAANAAPAPGFDEAFRGLLRGKSGAANGATQPLATGAPAAAGGNTEARPTSNVGTPSAETQRAQAPPDKAARTGTPLAEQPARLNEAPPADQPSNAKSGGEPEAADQRKPDVADRSATNVAAPAVPDPISAVSGQPEHATSPSLSQAPPAAKPGVAQPAGKRGAVEQLRDALLADTRTAVADGGAGPPAPNPPAATYSTSTSTPTARPATSPSVPTAPPVGGPSPGTRVSPPSPIQAGMRSVGAVAAIPADFAKSTGDFAAILASVKEDDSKTLAFIREAEAAGCIGPARTATECALSYTADHKNDVPEEYFSRRNAEHYLVAKGVCEMPGNFFAKKLGTGTPKIVDVTVAATMAVAIPLYSLLKDVNLYWGLLFPEAGRYISAGEWLDKVEDAWSRLARGPVPRGTLRGYLDAKAFGTSPGTLKEGYWALKGLVDCYAEKYAGR